MTDVLFMTRKWSPAVGGMETYSVKLVEALQTLVRLRVVRLAGRPNGHPPSATRLLGFGICNAARLLLNRSPPIVLHLGDMALWPLGAVARLRSRHSRIVLSAHGTDVAYHRRGGFKGRAYECYLRLGARWLRDATVVANSNATKAATEETGWHKIDVVPLATDIQGSLPIGEPQSHVLFAGRLVERKGCAWFIRNVLPLLPSDVKLKVAGTGWDDSEWQALDHPRVEFLGSLHGADLVDAYRRALCVIVPNIEPESGEFEGFGLVATEAAAAGGLVVAANSGGLVQAVEPGVTGWLVPSGDAPQWRDAIVQIARLEKAERRAFLMRSMAHCRTYYCWDRVARETIQFYGLPAE